MLKNTIQDAFKRLIEPSIDREIRSDLTEKAEEQGQLSMYNYKLAEIAHQLDLVKLDSVTPIEALNILSKIKENMA